MSDEEGNVITEEKFNPNLIFTDIPSQNKIEGEIYENKEPFVLKLPAIENVINLDIATEEKTTKINLESKEVMYTEEVVDEGEETEEKTDLGGEGGGGGSSPPLLDEEPPPAGPPVAEAPGLGSGASLPSEPGFGGFAILEDERIRKTGIMLASIIFLIAIIIIINKLQNQKTRKKGSKMRK